MSEGFVILNRGQETSDLLQHDHMAFILLTYAALHGRWSEKGLNPYKCEVGEAVICKPEKLGMTRQQMRSKIKKLEKWNLIITRTTNKGTYIKPIGGVYRDVGEKDNQQITNEQPTDNQQITNEQPTDNQRITNEQPLTKKVKKDKKVNNDEEEESAPSPTVIHSTKKLQIIQEVIEGISDINPAWAGTAKKKEALFRMMQGYNGDTVKEGFMEIQDRLVLEFSDKDFPVKLFKGYLNKIETSKVKEYKMTAEEEEEMNSKPF